MGLLLTPIAATLPAPWSTYLLAVVAGIANVAHLYPYHAAETI